jgi:hypothetical protein
VRKIKVRKFIVDCVRFQKIIDDLVVETAWCDGVMADGERCLAGSGLLGAWL